MFERQNFGDMVEATPVVVTIAAEETAVVRVEEVSIQDAWERVRRRLRAELGEDEVETIPPAMGSEDFGWLAQAIDVPNVYWVFGAYSPEAERRAMNHSPFFLPEIEPALGTGVRAAIAAIGAYVAV